MALNEFRGRESPKFLQTVKETEYKKQTSGRLQDELSPQQGTKPPSECLKVQQSQGS